MLTRRDFLHRSALSLTVPHVFFAQAPVAAPVDCLIECPSGRLRGESRDGLRIFRGVPFAQPPVGPLRFRAPQPLAPWPGTRDASRVAAAAMQPNEPSIPQSEDCLYLNLWTPEDARNAPVLIWIHGGGFTGGRSFDPIADGSRFASAGIVCITVAYRLGVFGFLDMEPLLGPEYAGSANNGLRDLMLALEWIQENVRAFGGDPARVTIGGESAGAKLSDLLLGVPAAQPLFHQVISESGGAERIWPKSRSATAAQSFGHQWTSAPDRPLVKLADAPARELIEVQQQFTAKYPAHFPLRPQLDERLFTGSPLAAIRAGSARGKRLLLGTNRDESAFFLGPHPVKEPLASDLGNLSLDDFRAVEDHYRQLEPTLSPEALHIRSVTAEEYWVPSMRVAEAFVAGNQGSSGQAFVYRLDFPRVAGLPLLPRTLTNSVSCGTALPPRATRHPRRNSSRARCMLPG